MSECVLCDMQITAETDSAEHVIINAIGGHYKVRGILCVRCNSETGKTWDCSLAKDLHSLGLLVGVVRERGETPSMVVSNLEGQRLLLHADGTMSPAKVEFKESQDASGLVTVEFVARDIEEVRKILRGVKKKYPKLDVESALAKTGDKFIYLTSPLNFSMDFGGPLSGRSLVKSVLCFAVVNGVSAKDCWNAKSYLMNDSGEPCFGYWYARDMIVDRPNGVPLHCIAISSLGTDGQLIGYAEFYGVRRTVVCLAGSYSGPPVHAVYCIDPRTSEQLSIRCNLSLTKEELRAAYDYEKIPDGSMEAAFEPILREAYRRSHQRERERVIDRAVDHAFKNIGVAEGEVLTDEELWRLSGLVAEHMRPYLEQVLVKGRRKDEQ